MKLPEGNVTDADLSEILLKRKLKASAGVGWHVAEVGAPDAHAQSLFRVQLMCVQTASGSSLI